MDKTSVTNITQLKPQLPSVVACPKKDGWIWHFSPIIRGSTVTGRLQKELSHTDFSTATFNHSKLFIPS
jgi:hypothetical protein